MVEKRMKDPPTPWERDATRRVGQKRLGENGYPQAAPTAEEQDAANRTKVTVTAPPKRE